MKKTMLLSFVFLFSIFVTACNDDDDDDNNPSTQNPPANADPSFTAIISGDITDTISFTVDGGIFTEQSILGSYSSALNFLSLNAMELPTGFQIGMVGNRDSFGEGDYTADGTLGYGGYTDNAQGRAFVGTACTVSFDSVVLFQDVVQATYTVHGSFSMTLEDTSTPPREIEIDGTFENITIGVN